MILSSVIIAVIKLAGVTSNAGLYTFTPPGAVFVPDMQVTSSEHHCSIIISSPFLVAMSIVEIGHDT